jgi:class 3 adenylate cyclase
MEAGDVAYAERPDGVNIAYRVLGDGPRDILYVPGFFSHLDLGLTEPRFAAFMRRLTGFARVITFDKPGTGLSDPIQHVPTVEERAEDIRHVADAVGAARPVLLGFSEGTSSCAMFAATWPDRVEALVLYGAVFNARPDPAALEDWGEASELEARWARAMQVVDRWGTGATMDLICPSIDSPAERRMWALLERASASPRMAQALVEAVLQIDVTATLPAIQAPTLLLHRTGDFAPVQQSRVAATLIPGARFVELPGADHAFWVSDPEPVLDEIEEFVTGASHAAEPDRVLATVLFADLVGSTQLVAELGDARWRERLERHEALVHRLVAAWRGRVVKAMGDGHLCVFDGPARAIRCGLALREECEGPLRVGIHTGECETIGDDVGGMTVHIGARVGALAAPGEVLVSSTVRDLVVGSPLAFADRGEHELKGVPGAWRVHAAGPAEAPPPLPTALELRGGDRVALSFARRAPGTARAAVRLTQRLGARRLRGGPAGPPRSVP